MAVRKLLYASFLVALIAFKVSSMAIHIHLHHADDYEHDEQHCELCKLALDFIGTEFSSTSENQIIEVAFGTNFNLPKERYNSVCIVSPSYSTLFGRPPPTLV